MIWITSGLRAQGDVQPVRPWELSNHSVELFAPENVKLSDPKLEPLSFEASTIDIGGQEAFRDTDSALARAGGGDDPYAGAAPARLKVSLNAQSSSDGSATDEQAHAPVLDEKLFRALQEKLQAQFGANSGGPAVELDLLVEVDANGIIRRIHVVNIEGGPVNLSGLTRILVGTRLFSSSGSDLLWMTLPQLRL